MNDEVIPQPNPAHVQDQGGGRYIIGPPNHWAEGDLVALHTDPSTVVKVIKLDPRFPDGMFVAERVPS